MQIIKHTIETKATPAQIWKVWEDVENWKKWDHQIETSQIDGPFQTGTPGSTKFANTPLIRTLLTQVVPMKLVAQESYLTLAKVVSHQSMHQIGGKTHVTFTVEIRGLLSLFYNCIIGRFIKKKIPPEMELMAKRAENSTI